MKRILFVAGQKNYNLFNRRSAVDSILCSLLLELNKHYDISINGSSLTDGQETMDDGGRITQLSEQGFVSRFVPEKWKAWRRNRLQRIENDRLFYKLKSGPPPNLIFELPKLGCDVGRRIREHFEVPYLIYSDSPLAEQFEDIMGFPCDKDVARMELDAIIACDRAVAYSPAMAEYWQSKYAPLDPVKFSYFQTLDYSRLTFRSKPPKEGKLCIGFVGTFMPWHRVDLLVTAYERLRRDGHELRLLLLGAGEEFEKVREQIRNSEFQSSISAMGFLDGKALVDQKSRIDIGVMPGSNWYGMPTKVFEYGAMGIPAVAPDTPTIQYVFEDGKDLLLFENNSGDALYHALRKLVEDSGVRAKLAANLQEKVQSQFKAESAVDFYRRLIDDL